eukprot:466198-Prorocentrum_minimum.AAC.35
MRETPLQRLDRLIRKAGAEGEQIVANVPVGTLVANVKDVTEFVERQTNDKMSVRELRLWWIRYSNTFTNASVECLRQGRPSLLIYMRNTDGTLPVFRHCFYTETVAKIRVMFGPDFSLVGRGQDQEEDLLMGFVRQMVGNVRESCAQSLTEQIFSRCSICTCLRYSLTSQFRCAHLLCTECIVGMWKVQGNKMSCPQCRKPLRRVEDVSSLVSSTQVEVDVEVVEQVK